MRHSEGRNESRARIAGSPAILSSVAKQKRPGARKVRKAIGQQLRFIARDLKHVTTLANQNGLDLLS